MAQIVWCWRCRESVPMLEPHEWSVMGPDGEPRRFVSVSVFDPDGYFYEFNQLLS